MPGLGTWARDGHHGPSHSLSWPQTMVIMVEPGAQLPVKKQLRTNRFWELAQSLPCAYAQGQDLMHV